MSRCYEILLDTETLYLALAVDLCGTHQSTQACLVLGRWRCETPLLAFGRSTRSCWRCTGFPAPAITQSTAPFLRLSTCCGGRGNFSLRKMAKAVVQSCEQLVCRVAPSLITCYPSCAAIGRTVSLAIAWSENSEVHTRSARDATSDVATNGNTRTLCVWFAHTTKSMPVVLGHNSACGSFALR